MNDLDLLLEQNLASYIEANSTVLPSDFKVKRELSIARLSLEESLRIHQLATKTLRAALEKLSSTTPADNTSTANEANLSNLVNIITLVNHMEERGHRLTQNCKAVAGIAKTGAEIENLLATKLDAVQIYSIISQLPTLLLSLLNSLLLQFFNERNLTINNGKVLDLQETVSEIAAVVSNAFTEQIEQSVSVLTYPTSSSSPLLSNKGKDERSGGGVIESQVVAMLNSVPTNTTVVPPDSQLANTLRTL